MQRVPYRFVPTKKVEVKTPSGNVYLFSAPRSGGQCSLRENEYELASLFNGRRSEEEIRDLLLNTKALALSAEDLRAFVDKLFGLGLLEAVEPPVRARPRIAAGAADTVHPRDAGAAAPVVALPPPARSGASAESTAQEEPALSSWRRARAVPPYDARAPFMRRFPGSAPIKEALGAEDIAFDESELGQPDEETPAPAWSGGGGGSVMPPGLFRRGGPEEDGPAGGLRNDRDALRPRSVKLLFRFPVRWLLPLASPLAWAAWSGYLALALGIVMIGEVLGLWFSRVELVRDLVRWFAPLTIFHTVLLSVLAVNLSSQLARAAEFRRRVGSVPPFGVKLAHNVIPVFVADVSGLAQVKDPRATRAVIGASVSAIATLCVLAYAGWFVTKNNGTSFPLLCLGVAVLATIRLLFTLNPLGRGDGYFLIALRAGVPDLRERAFVTLLAGLTGRSLPRGWSKSIPAWVLGSYALAVLSYLVAVVVLLVIFGGGWLEEHWGGFGVVAFLTLAMLVLWGPVRDARHRLGARSGAVQLRRPRERRTLGQRIWSMTKLGVVLAVLVGVGLIPYRYEPGGEFLLRPLQASRTDVRSLISGRVDEVPVKEGDHVRESQLLARVSGDEERKNVETTEANIRELQAQLAKAVTGATKEQIAVARQKVNTSKTRYEFSKSKAERYTQLKESGFSSPQEYENVLGQAENDRETLQQAERELELLLAGTRKEEIDALRAAIDQQKANLAYHKQQLQYTDVRAPIAGHIVSGSLLTAAGNYLKNGDLFATIEDTSRLLAEIKVPQSDIGLVKVGAPIRLKAWSLPDLEIKGVVQSIAPSAEETPAGKMVRVTAELDNRNGALKSGLTGYAKIEGDEMPAALAFTRIVVRFFQIEFWSWLP